MSTARIRSIVILGGGTAGWMTAAALSRALAGQTVAITLVESDTIGTVGVGEATIPTIHWFNQITGLDERQFMAETSATLKLGIEFVGWNGPDSRYFHPFGTFGPPGDGAMFLHRLLRGRADGDRTPTEAYSLTAQSARANRFARPVSDRRSLLSTLGYAYHFDAGLYARYLRGAAERAGVVRVEGTAAEVLQISDTGDVQALVLEDGRRVAGDFFIDCSGLRGRLIGQALGVAYDDWSHWLPCDRAWAAPGQAEDIVTPYTRATAAEAGWRWRIPLRRRVGNGYVFSSRFQTEEAARQSLLAGMEGPPSAEPRLIRFLPGMRNACWERNVIAIGLSSGFLEPLESTSIHLIQSGIAKLLSLFPAGDGSPLPARQFNRVFGQEMRDIRDFLILHYHATQGRTEPFWRERQAMTIPDTLAERLAHFRASGRIVLSTDELFRDASWFAVLDGQGERPSDHHPLVEAIGRDDNLRQLAALRQAIAAAAAAMPVLSDRKPGW
ncbi:tryptophan halogenase family protein [Sphingomonas abaci]|uniref:Tryptophan halogenase n=1 Tax=Sphingomonas abaci TaxID=237611 RepID=A0A7W7AJ44_9SPHN|nr:tryptophan halogenase family protein [Sphingomonas abaci]MBB4617174.1 tryptophan halogenase [Sphingomonas abaci]